jgi:hypothetical protein
LIAALLAPQCLWAGLIFQKGTKKPSLLNQEEGCRVQGAHDGAGLFFHLKTLPGLTGPDLKRISATRVQYLNCCRSVKIFFVQHGQIDISLLFYACSNAYLASRSSSVAEAAHDGCADGSRQTMSHKRTPY